MRNLHMLRRPESEQDLPNADVTSGFVLVVQSHCEGGRVEVVDFRGEVDGGFEGKEWTGGVADGLSGKASGGAARLT